MLNLTYKTMEALGDPAYRSFVDRMARHIKEFFPGRFSGVGDPELRDFIRTGIGKARRYGIVRECDVAKFIDLSVALHPDFDSNSETSWALGILNNLELTPAARLDLIYRTMLMKSGVATF